MADEKPFVVTLPRELSREHSIPGYADIKKIGGTLATDAHAAVLKYLHRVHKEKASVIFDVLRRSAGGIESLAFEVPEVVSADGKPLNSFEKRKMTEYALAWDIASSYHNEPNTCQAFHYLPTARTILDEFDRLSINALHQ